MSDKNGNTIIIKKIKKNKAGHHGGAWKIAYADFVTAMMAFFLLLWLISSLSDKELASIAQYFTPTTGLFGQMGIGFRGGQQLDIDGTRNEKIASPSLVLGAPTNGAVIDMGSFLTGCINSSFLACKLILASLLLLGKPYFKSPLIGQPILAS